MEKTTVNVGGVPFRVTIEEAKMTKKVEKELMSLKGIQLSFGTEVVGSNSVKLQFTNEWLTLKIYITADRGTTFIECYDCEAFEFIGTITEEQVPDINEICYDSIESFNRSIYSVLFSYFTKFVGTDEDAQGNLKGFDMTGLALDLD